MKRILALIAISMALTGCNNFRTPHGVLITAAGALYGNDVKTYTQCLDGAARKTWGNIPAFVAMQVMLSRYTDLQFGETRRLPNDPALGLTRAISYEVDILGKYQGHEVSLWRTVRVDCDRAFKHKAKIADAPHAKDGILESMIFTFGCRVTDLY